ncbi:hypothetical protein [Cellulomonas sp. P24]|uniref:hypothetical protein n=1 Tax=Cellulomonas sp. P24 TaxID=2885206 RepID=UPI00216B398A|nr:hypothetical protein [Cellulomonas sp. P24]MCR6493308.1 hypothetical protein [Cellulomonas sp. P24]
MTALKSFRAGRRTAATAAAALGIGALLTATASSTWAAPVTTATDAARTVVADTTGTPAPTSTSTSTSTSTPSVVVNGSTVTITRELAQVQAMCARVPDVQKRIAAALARIQGGSDVHGSVAWLQARAADQRAAGHADAAKRLDDRATLRSDRVAELTKRADRLTVVERNICAPVAAQTGTGTSS